MSISVKKEEWDKLLRDVRLLIDLYKSLLSKERELLARKDVLQDQVLKRTRMQMVKDQIQTLKGQPQAVLTLPTPLPEAAKVEAEPKPAVSPEPVPTFPTRPQPKFPAEAGGHRATSGLVLSIPASLLIGLNCLLFLEPFKGTIPSISQRVPQLSPILSFYSAHSVAMAVTAILCASMVALGSIQINAGRPRPGGALVILFSLVSIALGGGFLLGAILGVIGGLIGLTAYRSE